MMDPKAGRPELPEKATTQPLGKEPTKRDSAAMAAESKKTAPARITRKKPK
jgi:hypothetical protein